MGREKHCEAWGFSHFKELFSTFGYSSDARLSSCVKITYLTNVYRQELYRIETGKKSRLFNASRPLRSLRGM